MKIELINVNKKIKGKSILENINITLEVNKVYGIEGINGSGKTMLMRLILGFITADSGEVLFNGENISKKKLFAQNAGFLLETPAFINEFTAKKNLQYLADIRNKVGEKEIIDILRWVKLDPESKKHFKKFSLGMKQRLGIAVAFFEQPELVILDEPMNGLDTDGIEIVKKTDNKTQRKGGNDNFILP